MFLPPRSFQTFLHAPDEAIAASDTLNVGVSRASEDERRAQIRDKVSQFPQTDSNRRTCGQDNLLHGVDARIRAATEPIDTMLA